MKHRVYVETSVISYLASRPARDLIVAAHQELTREWWEAWNCKHLANASLRVQIAALLEDAGYACPVICTPEELMEG